MAAKFEVENVNVVEENEILKNKSVGIVTTTTSSVSEVTANPLLNSVLSQDNKTINESSITSQGSLALYQEELELRPMISSVLPSLPHNNTTTVTDSSTKRSKKTARFGTLMGVYLPTLQNILGVILFLRLTWIVGTAGVGQALLIVLLCCTCTFMTTLSLCAIATNGVVPGGGAYFVISRNLGPEVGGAVGIQFYLADTFGTSLYIIGAIEILLTYVAPEAALFGEIQGNPQILYHNLRVYGTVLLLLMTVVVFVGVKFVSYFATLCLIAVIVAVASIYAGCLNPIERGQICTVNNVALVGGFICPPLANASVNDNRSCSEDNVLLQGKYSEVPSSLGVNISIYDSSRDPPWEEGFEPTCQTGIPGITRSKTIIENTPSSYMEEGDGAPGQPAIGNQVEAAITSSFLVLIGIFFPSVTGIMTGSNRAGDLKNAQKSIPIGTIAAQLTTSILYITCVLFFGATISGALLKDQFGYSTGDLTVSSLAFPSKWIILIGALLSTIGAGLQTLTSASRVLHVIANDELIPILRVFKTVSSFNHEPTFALILTVLLAEVGVLIASLDLVAPILSMFYLICYTFVNTACFVQSLLKSPNWRPKFAFYHWTLSLFGTLLCLAIMFMISWYYALVSIVIAIVIYKYIEFRGAKKEWGDGFYGLNMEAARLSLLKLEDRPTHTKNWRPQLLVLVRLDDHLIPTHPKLLAFASQLKAGKGLTVIGSVVTGQLSGNEVKCKDAKKVLKQLSKENKIKGFVNVIASRNRVDGLSALVQVSGLGGLTHNTIVIAWPEQWKTNSSWDGFIETLYVASLRELAILVPKGINWYPSRKDRMSGYIDVWWIVHDGGLLMLLPFLLRQHKVWRSCQLRIFAVAQETDNSVQMKHDLIKLLHQLRIEAKVDIIEMYDSDISTYTYERTLKMEERERMLRKMGVKESDIKHEVQSVLSHSFAFHPTDSIHVTPASEVQHTNTEKELPEDDEEMNKPDTGNVLRMHTSIKLNELMVSKSKEAALVIVNLPRAPTAHLNERFNYMEFIDALTEGLHCVLLVRGGGCEVVTVYS